MKVILIRDVENLGKKYDVKDVKDGYARNFLIPKGMVKLATEKALKWLKTQKEIEAKKSEEELKKNQELASSIDGLEVPFAVKVGKEGQLFESINPQKISEKLKEMGFEIPKTRIELTDSIKEAGEFPVKVRFEHNLETEIKIIVNEEK